MKTIGWIIIICTVLGVIFNGISTTFEGIIAPLSAIVIGVICIIKGSK